MMKRLVSLVLSFVMLSVLLLPAAAAEGKPTPPPWVKAEEYAVFSDGKAYEKENWERILRLRADAAAGNPAPRQGQALHDDYRALEILVSSGKEIGSASLDFEFSLIALRYRCNLLIQPPVFSTARPSASFSKAVKDGGGQEPQTYLAHLWDARARFVNFGDLSSGSSGEMEMFAKLLGTLYNTYPQFQPSDIVDWDMARLVPEDYRQMVRDGVVVTLDDRVVHPAVLSTSPILHESSFACIRNGVTMVPVRRLAELLGATVEYQKGKITMTRAGVTAMMNIDSTQATVGGKALQMSAAPFKENGKTFVPVGDIAELFGQKLEFIGRNQVSILEDKSSVGSSNLEKWAIPMGSMLNSDYMTGHYYGYQGKKSIVFGGATRYGMAPMGLPVGNTDNRRDTPGRDRARKLLNGDSWGIMSREDLIQTVCAMTVNGHNSRFRYDVALIRSMTPAEYQRVLNNATGMDKYMFPYTKQLGEKWGDRGILCWDLFRMSNLVQWGYLAGYLTYPEALALLEPAAKLLHDNFKSWDEAYENYLDGYNWWARNDVGNRKVWDTPRGKTYQQMKKDAEVSIIFDNSLFQKPVTGVPGLTAEQLLASVRPAA